MDPSPQIYAEYRTASLHRAKWVRGRPLSTQNIERKPLRSSRRWPGRLTRRADRAFLHGTSSLRHKPRRRLFFQWTECTRNIESLFPAAGPHVDLRRMDAFYTEHRNTMSESEHMSPIFRPTYPLGMRRGLSAGQVGFPRCSGKVPRYLWYGSTMLRVLHFDVPRRRARCSG